MLSKAKPNGCCSWYCWSVRSLIAGVFAASLLLAAAGGALAGAPSASASTVSGPIIQAHRGGSPANTLSGVRTSVDAGANEIEVDVRESADGVLVLSHDNNLPSSCAPFSGWPVRSLTAAQLATVRCSGQQIPELTEFLDYMTTASQSMMLDLKRYSATKEYGHQSDASLKLMTRTVLAQLSERGLIDRSYLSSSDWIVVAEGAHTAGMPMIRLAAGEVTPSLARVRTAAQLGVTEYSINVKQADFTLINAVKRSGMGITLWGLTNDADMRFAASVGSRYLSVDSPCTITQLRGESGSLAGPARPTYTSRSAKMVLEKTLRPRVRSYPTVLGSHEALPTAARSRLVGARVVVSITHGDGHGFLRIGARNDIAANDKVIRMPHGSRSVTVTVPVGDGGKLHVYTTNETAKVKITVRGHYNASYNG